MQALEQLRLYAERYFLTLPALAEGSALPLPAFHDLIEAGALPQPSYSLWPNGAFASPIGGHHGPAPAGAPTHFYSAAALWWARRASIAALPAAKVAASFRAEFIADFVTRLRAEPLGPLGYPQAYDHGSLDEGRAKAAASAEWQDWIVGGYGVCLRAWDAHHAITKTCQRALIVTLTREGEATSLPQAEYDQLLVAMQALDAVMLPFAPHQRPHGTPGLWIDRMLDRFGLRHAPSGGLTENAAEKYCA